MALSPTFMADVARTYGKPDEFAELVFGGTPGLHAGQVRYAGNAVSDVNFLLPGNSWGKTEFIVRYLLYLAWFKEGPHRPSNFLDWVKATYNALVASYDYSVAQESFDRLDHYYKNREQVRALVENVSRADPKEVRLTNGSKLDWGSLYQQGRGVEATRYNVIFVDEAGHIPDISYTFDSILFPRTMGVGGRIHLIGTPKAHSDPFLLELYEKGKNGDDPFYFAQGGSVLENEFWPREEQDRVLRNPRYVKGWNALAPGEEPQGELALCVRDIDGVPSVPVLTPMGRQVILGAFVIAGGYFFNRWHIQRMFAWDGPEPEWTNGDSFGFKPIEGHLYVGAWDLAGNKARKKKKRGSDPTVGMVVDYTEKPWKLAAFHYIPGGDMDWEQKYDLMKQVHDDFHLPYTIVDVTGNVDSVQEALQNRGIEVEGIHFGGQGNKKFDMLRNLQLVLEMKWGGTTGALRSPLIPQLKYELDHYIIPDDDIQQDCVMTLAMVAHELAQNELPPSMAGEVF